MTRSSEFTKILNQDKKDVTDVGKIVMRLIKVIKGLRLLKKDSEETTNGKILPYPLYSASLLDFKSSVMLASNKMVSADTQIESWLKLILDIGEGPLCHIYISIYTHTHIYTYIYSQMTFSFWECPEEFKECLAGLSFGSGLISEAGLLSLEKAASWL